MSVVKQAYTRAVNCYPDIDVTEEAFADFVGEPVNGARWNDLFLVCAASQGCDTASRILCERADQAIRRRLHNWPLHEVEDAIQATFSDAFAPASNGQLAIASFSGRASIESWFCVVAARKIARTWKRTRKDEVVASESEPLCDEVIGMSEALIKSEQKKLLKACFQASLASLAPEERVLLKQTVLDGLSSSALATLYNKHRATISRKLENIRSDLRKRTLKRLRDQANITDREELEEFLDIVSSQIELSLSRILKAA